MILIWTIVTVQRHPLCLVPMYLVLKVNRMITSTGFKWWWANLYYIWPLTQDQIYASSSVECVHSCIVQRSTMWTFFVEYSDIWNKLKIIWYFREARCRMWTFIARLEAEFIYNLFKWLDVFKLNEITIPNDNNPARLTVAGSGDFSRNKHYRININLIKEVVQMGWLKIVRCSSEDMIADYLTKPLAESQFLKLVSISGVSPSCNLVVYL